MTRKGKFAPKGRQGMRQSQQQWIRTWPVVLVALAVVGCSSNKGPDRTAKAVESFKDTRKHLADASKQVGATNDSLRALSAGGGDLRPLFDKYVANVKRTQDMADGARKRADAMRAKTDEYTKQWQKELSAINDAQLRAQSQQRVAAAKAEFDRVRSAAAEVKTAYQPYRQGLNDVQQYLTNDLTTAGVQSVGTKANDTIRKGETLQQRIADLERELDALAGKWSAKLETSK